MQRLIQNKIKKPLAEDILFGRLAKQGGLVRVDVEDGELQLIIEEEVLA
jgi:ATP-dependent Clp protease ATP-binding subunit ClpA